MGRLYFWKLFRVLDAVFTILDLPQKHNINIETIKMTWNWISY